MTEREHDEVEVPERTHDQPAEGGREQADEAADQTPAPGAQETDSSAEPVE